MKININLNFIPPLNKVVKYFILSDLILLFGWGLLDPIFAIFVIRNVEGATLIAIGFLATIYWVSKGIFQIPISLYLDRTDGEKDDFYALIFGLMIVAVTAFSLMLVTKMWHVYIVQLLKAVGFALYVPAWSAIFSRHLDKEHTAFDWAVSSSTVSFGIGLAGFLGGSLASIAGFKVVFLAVGLMALSSAAMLLFVPDLILPRKTASVQKIIDHTKLGLK